MIHIIIIMVLLTLMHNQEEKREQWKKKRNFSALWQLGSLSLYLFYHRKLTKLMVLTLDGNSTIGSHLMSNLCYLICLWHLTISRVVTKPFFLHACSMCSELPSNISTMVLPFLSHKVNYYYFCITFIIILLNK